MVIEVNKDIDRYQESVAMGLTARQLIFSIASVVVGGGQYPCLLRLPLSLPPILINPLFPAFLSLQYSPHTYPFHPDTVP